MGSAVEIPRFLQRLHGLAQGLLIDRAGETARESSRQLLERKNVQAVFALACSSQAPLAHRMATLGYYGVTVHGFHHA